MIKIIAKCTALIGKQTDIEPPEVPDTWGMIAVPSVHVSDPGGQDPICVTTVWLFDDEALQPEATEDVPAGQNPDAPKLIVPFDGGA